MIEFNGNKVDPYTARDTLYFLLSYYMNEEELHPNDDTCHQNVNALHKCIMLLREDFNV